MSMSKGNEIKTKRTTSEHSATMQGRSGGVILKTPDIAHSETAVDVRKKLNSFSHSIYDKAAQIFLHLKGKIPATELPTFEEDFERRRAYSLAFGAKRCK